MLHQTFSLIDIPRLITFIFLESILSVDNALALALIARNLSSSLRKKALFTGFILATILRTIGILFVAYFIHLFWIQILAGIYLLCLAISHFIWKNSPKQQTKKSKTSFWKVVILIELTDFAFALDSILAGLALINAHSSPTHLPSKIWIVYFGAMVGIFLMRFAAKFLIDLIHSLPKLENGAYLIIGWIGLKLIFESLIKIIQPTNFNSSKWIESTFWIGLILLFTFSFFSKKNNQKYSSPPN